MAKRLVVLSPVRPTSLRGSLVSAHKLVLSRLGCADVFCPSVSPAQSTEQDASIGTKRLVLFFGRTRYNKGFDLLLPIADEVSKARNDVLFIIAGQSVDSRDDRASGWASERARMLAEMRARSDFWVRDEFIPDDEIPALFQSSAAALLPYRDATQSGVVTSAMEYACPIVATNIPGLNDVLKDRQTARLAPCSAQGIAGALLDVLSDPSEARECAVRARDYFRREYSWDRIGQDMLAAYRATAGTGTFSPKS